MNKKFKRLNVKMKQHILNSEYIAMEQLPVEITRNIYEYDPTYR